MKLILRPALVLLALLPAGVRAQPPSEPQQFRISSRGTPFGVQGEFEGTFSVGRDAVEVFVSKATIYVSEHCPYKGRRAVEHVNFSLGVGTGPGGRWKLERSGYPLPVEQVMSPGDEYSLPSLYFKIPKPEAADDLTGRWLVVSIQSDALDLAPEQGTKGVSFASSCKEIFTAAVCRAGKERKPIN